MHRHDGVNNELIKWIPAAKAEQGAPKWDRPQDKAILDVAYQTTASETTYLDVSVVAAAGADPGSLLLRRGKAKHTRYPGPGLIPMVLTSRGRWGREGIAWARSAARHFFGPEAAEKFRELKYAVSASLQISVAEQILSCMTIPPKSCS